MKVAEAINVRQTMLRQDVEMRAVFEPGEISVALHAIAADGVRAWVSDAHDGYWSAFTADLYNVRPSE